MTERKLRLTRLDPSRDPLLKGVWIGGQGQLPAMPTPPTSQPFVIAPDPPPDPQAEKWTHAIDIAPDVIAALGDAVDYELLTAVVKDVVQGGLSVDDIVAIYCRRLVGGSSHG